MQALQWPPYSSFIDLNTVKILILGSGQVGSTVAQNLALMPNNDVTIIDISEEALSNLRDKLDVQTVLGNAASPTVLAMAGAEDADLVLALTRSDETNLVASAIPNSTTGKFSPPYARATGTSGSHSRRTRVTTGECRMRVSSMPPFPPKLSSAPRPGRCCWLITIANRRRAPRSPCGSWTRKR